MNRNLRLIVTAASAVAVTVVAVGAYKWSGTSPTTDDTQTKVEVSTATVERGDLSDTKEFKGSVSFGEPFALPVGLEGTITSQRLVGEPVPFGEWLIKVNETPVFLAKGTMPMYRELHLVDTTAKDDETKPPETKDDEAKSPKAKAPKPKLLNGEDVRQLQQFLLDAGWIDNNRLRADGTFGVSTDRAVKDWQKSVGFDPTGRVSSQQLVFNPEPLRIASEARVGDSFSELKVTSAGATVTVDTNNRDRAALRVGSGVNIALADGTELLGIVASQKQVTSEEGTTLWRTTINVDGTLPKDAPSADVRTSVVVAKDALHVPVAALVALAEGGFAVEVNTKTGTKFVPVEVGEVLDGQAEVSGKVTAGDQVVIAT